MIVLADLLDSLGLSASPADILPLEDGSMRFRQRWTAGRHEMKYDWVPCEPLPDGYNVTGVEIMNRQDRIMRAWTNGSDILSVAGLNFHSPGGMFFIREAEGVYYVAAGTVEISGRFVSCCASLVKNYNYCGSWAALGETLPAVPTVLAYAMIWMAGGGCVG